MNYSNLVNTSSSSMTSSFTTRKRESDKTWVMVREFDSGEEADNVRKNKEKTNKLCRQKYRWKPQVNRSRKFR
jgi:hypothetical protein